ncbi:FAD-dependent thymidylate synthase [bacterium]|nr:FAD-dependent thymidylate synthase [bacterium]
MIEVTYKGSMGNDLTVVNAARVSFGKESEWDYEESDAYSFKQHMKARDKKLIQYLAKHKHISPFGHCFASFHIKAPVFVARQLVKHKFLRWNEISRRYVDNEPEFFHPTEWRGRSEDRKQGSEGVIESLRPTYSKTLIKIAMDNYKHLLSEGVCPEQARMVLPQSMMTEWYWSGSLDAFADMCKLRCAPDTQAETAEVAWEIDRNMIDLFPVSWRALRDE